MQGVCKELGGFAPGWSWVVAYATPMWNWSWINTMLMMLGQQEFGV